MRCGFRLLASLLSLGAFAGAAAAEEPRAANPRRALAVLEYRGGSEKLLAVAERAEAILDRQTSLAVIGPDEARQRYGAALDADLGKCAGDAACLAEIGARLGVDEVLLFGVNELGDVILAVQRIEVAGREVRARMAEALPPGEDPDDDALLTYLRRVLPRSDFRRYGLIRVNANVAGADVLIGSRPRGQTPLAPLKVPAPATYEIAVTKPGYTDFRASVAVPPDGEVLVRTELTERTTQAWYQKWWVLALAGTVAVGATTAAVLTTRGGDRNVDVGIAPF